MDRNYYMVRARRSQTRDFNVFFDNKMVAVGWRAVDFTRFSLEETQQLREEVRKVYYGSGDWHQPTVGKKINEVDRFQHIKEGDYIVVPYYNSIRLAIAKKEHIYSEQDYEFCKLSAKSLPVKV